MVLPVGAVQFQKSPRQHRCVRGGKAQIGERRGGIGEDRVGQSLAHVRDEPLGVTRRKLGHVEPEFTR